MEGGIPPAEAGYFHVILSEMKFFFHFGRYLLMLRQMLSKPENGRMYWEETVRQMASIGLGSVGIVAFVAVFMGGVSAVQTVYQLVAPYISLTVVGSIVTNSSILELGPSVTSLVLAGKIGSNIASELGYMRSSEQIDALEIMGVNPVAYLVGPKVLACLTMIPLLVVVSISTAIAGTLDAALRTTALPATSAGAVFQTGMAQGKFQGVMMETTPRGSRTV